MKERESGILLHITSLPSPYGIGDFGPEAYKFVNFLTETNQSLWQILPLNPTDPALGNSPYSSYSAFAGNPILISPDLLVEEGLLLKSEVEDHPSFPREKVDYEAVTEYKRKILHLTYEKSENRIGKEEEFEDFCTENSFWLEDYTLFVALKEQFKGIMWGQWPEDLRDRREDAIKEWKTRLADKIQREKFFQYLFFKQWFSLKNYCRSKNVRIIGDLPIYVSYDSADVWANPQLFKLDEEKKPAFVAGVPPDYFSETGQLWGNPVYRWDVLRETRYAWWIKRIEHNLKLFDQIRLDHFRGFVAYWEVPASEKTAVKGQWVEVSVKDFFSTLSRRFVNLPIIAEDLGVITPEVIEVMELFGFPGMKVLVFAFGEDLPTSVHAPHNYVKNCVVYTGTHDNNTAKGWFQNESTQEDRERFCKYIGREVPEEEVHWEFVRLALMSVAKIAIIPLQDILGLGEEARMNLPATSRGNWMWRFLPEQLTPAIKRKLLEMTRIYGRAQHSEGVRGK
jgi:4-alpha-glucanotransferase